MAGDLRTIIEAARTALTTLGYTPSREVFNFDAVPDSIVNRSYRIETRRLASAQLLGGKEAATDAIEIYVAYKLKQNAAAVADAALDDREEIEKSILGSATISALSQHPLLAIDGEASAEKYLDNYLISRTVLRVDYIRDLN